MIRKARSRSRSVYRRAGLRLAATGIRYAGRYAARRAGEYMKGGGYQQPMTSQKDTRLIYKKKSMPRRKRKQWTSFKKKVTAVQISNTQLQMVCRQQTMFLTTIANASACCFTGLYGLAGGVGSTGTTGVASGTGQCDDISDIFVGKYVSAAASAGRKLMFASACLDVHVQVTGAANMILEVYEISARKDFAAMSAAYDQVEEIYNQAFADLPVMAGGLPSAVGSNLGTTPFNSKTFCQYFKINKKYRVQGSPGELLSFQMRDPKNYLIDGNICTRPQMNWRRNQFKGYFFQMYGCPVLAPATTLSSAAECKITSIKSYTFRQFDSETAGAAQAN